MDDAESKKADIFNRDQVLAKIEDLIGIKDEVERDVKTKEFIEARVAFLTASAVPGTITTLSTVKKGFIHPESQVRRSYFVDPFFIDDPEIYAELIDAFREFKEDSDWQVKTLREIAPFAVLRAIGKYFGNAWTTKSTESENQLFYLDRSAVDSEAIHLNELRGKGIAVCAEKASVAQNLLTFLGYESELVVSSNCRLEGTDEDDNSAHMYNVITNGQNHSLYDANNPVIIYGEGRKIQSVVPAIFPLDHKGYEDLMRGGQIRFVHNDVFPKEGKMVKGPDQIRIYGGPRRNS